MGTQFFCPNLIVLFFLAQIAGLYRLFHNKREKLFGKRSSALANLVVKPDKMCNLQILRRLRNGRIVACFIFCGLFFGFSACRPTESQSLAVYIEDPELFYALSLYQQIGERAPLSVHVRRGFDLFLQISGQQPNNASASTPHGLFLSTELPQLLGQELYLESLPPEFQNSTNSSSPASFARGAPQTRAAIPEDSSAQPNLYLLPILLYPLWFEIPPPTTTNSLKNPQNDPLNRNFAQSGLPRLLHREWLGKQLLKAPNDSTQFTAYPQNPQQILYAYLKWANLQVRFAPQGFELGAAGQTSPLKGFLPAYRQALANPTKTQEGRQKDRIQQNQEFVERQKQLYEDVPRHYLLRSPKSPLPRTSYPSLYMAGAIEEPQNGQTRPTLRLQLDKVLWGAISQGLGARQREQAHNLLRWLQSEAAQQSLQQTLPRLDDKLQLGIFGGLSLHESVNRQFWQDLQLDWPSQFAIEWQLPQPLAQWQPEVFVDLNRTQTARLRSTSPTEVVETFLLPYLFLDPNAPKTGFHSVNWGL